MTDHQQPGLDAPLGEGSSFVADRGRLGLGHAGVGADSIEPSADSEPDPTSTTLDDWAMPESGPVSIQRSMPAELTVIDLEPEKAPSPDQLARRARLQRIVVVLVAALGIFDVVMLWGYYH